MGTKEGIALFTSLYLALRGLPDWLRRVRRENPLAFAAFVLLVVLPVGVLLDFLTFRDEVVYAFFVLALPGLWVIVVPFLAVHLEHSPGLPGRRARAVLPIVAMTLADLLAMPAILFSRHALGAESSTELYVLFLATVLRVGGALLVGSRPYRGKAIVDGFVGILAFLLAVVVYSLAITA